MRILVTMPGKFGDILWSLATARAIAETFGVRVDFMVSGAYGGIAPLIMAQDYIEGVSVNGQWKIQETAPITPWAAPTHPIIQNGFDHIFDLGYRGWPTEKTLAEECYKSFTGLGHAKIAAPLDLDRPWIKAPEGKLIGADNYDIFVGWNEQWIELKMGVTFAVATKFPKRNFTIVSDNWKSRHAEWVGWEDGAERPARIWWDCLSWSQAAQAMDHASCYLGCLSSQWVLANAMGKPTVVMEPDPDRARNPLFWLPRERNHMVIGGDGLPTFDARHTGDLLREVLGG